MAGRVYAGVWTKLVSLAFLCAVVLTVTSTSEIRPAGRDQSSSLPRSAASPACQQNGCWLVTAFPAVVPTAASRSRLIRSGRTPTASALSIESSSRILLVGRAARRQQPAESSSRPAGVRSTTITKRFSSSPKTPKDQDTDESLLPKGTGGEGIQTILTVAAGQMLLVVVAVLAARLVDTPNFGLGSNIALSWTAVRDAVVLTVPLGVLAVVLDRFEDRVPALQNVAKATQRSVLAFMGSTFRPGTGLGKAVVLGLAAGISEEWLFRGVLQFELAGRIGDVAGVALSSIVFGLLHAVTPLYAILAGLASLYFGAIYLYTDNLAVPMACHALYDIGALFFAHWTVCQLSRDEMLALARWERPGKSETTKSDVLK